MSLTYDDDNDDDDRGGSGGGSDDDDVWSQNSTAINTLTKIYITHDKLWMTIFLNQPRLDEGSLTKFPGK